MFHSGSTERSRKPWIFLSGFLALLIVSPALIADSNLDASAESQSNGEEAADDATATDLTFLDSVTVAATGSERSLKETPGQIDVVGAEEIEQLGYTGIDDLVRFMPGVYVEGDLTRLGTSGFNIRGIGGNRVMTQIDGVPTAEQFDFGPFSVTQYAVDLDALESAEVVRSAGSALYGSDALGGVVSLVTRSPRSYLKGAPQYFGFRAGYDGRNEELSESLVYARGGDTWQGSVVYTHRDASELDNQGTLETEDFTRTAPNPIDRTQDNALFKLSRTGTSSQLEGSFEIFDSEAETEVLSGRAPASPFASAVRDIDAVDTQARRRISLEQSLVTSNAFLDSLLWRVYFQEADTEQLTLELREGFAGLSDREGLLTFDQETFGFQVESRKSFGASKGQVLTYGASWREDSFDQFRDRSEFFVDSGAPVPTSLVFPTKYFPRSDVQELGVFLQAELDFLHGRLRLVPGVRYDSYELDADESDTVYLTGNPGSDEPADIDDDAFSPKLGLVFALNDELSLFAQYAHGFRAPPMSAVNNGFTNQAGGYRTLPNADLQAETSDNIELGLRGSFARGSFSVAAFENQYDDFIETVSLGFNPANFLVEFQPQNLNEVEISGFELSAELRFGQAWRWRAAYALVEGDNVTADEPLESIAPSRFVTGLRYARPGSSWGAEAVLTAVSSKDADDLPSASDQFQTPSYEVLDLAAWFRITDHITLQAAAWNLTDETYWQWTYARGRTADSSTLDRYTSSGRSFGLQARVGF